jgi:hypothetical protein
MRDGNCGITLIKLRNILQRDFAFRPDIIADAASYGVAMNEIVIDGWRDRDVVFDKRRYRGEGRFAETIKDHAENWKGREFDASDANVAAYASNIELTGLQIAAIKAAVTHLASIITGGPGTGKTTIFRISAKVVGIEMSKLAPLPASPRCALRLLQAFPQQRSTAPYRCSPVGRGFQAMIPTNIASSQIS